MGQLFSECKDEFFSDQPNVQSYQNHLIKIHKKSQTNQGNQTQYASHNKNLRPSVLCDSSGGSTRHSLSDLFCVNNRINDGGPISKSQAQMSEPSISEEEQVLCQQEASLCFWSLRFTDFYEALKGSMNKGILQKTDILKAFSKKFKFEVNQEHHKFVGAFEKKQQTNQAQEKFILIMLATTSPIPAGVLTPSFILGAVFGRLYGFVLKNIGIALGITLVQHEGIYAIVGAAALGGAVTRTVSIAMIVFEIIGQTSHMVPLLVGTLMAYAISNSMALSVYDALLEIKNLPFLPTMTGVSTFSLTAKELMNENFLYLTQDSNISDIAIIVSQVGFRPFTIPVVESANKKTLLFTVQAQNLRKHLFRTYKQACKKLEVEIQLVLNQYFYSLNCVNQDSDKNNAEFTVDPLINQKEHQIQQLSYIQGRNSLSRSKSGVSQSFLQDDYEGQDQNRKLERQQIALEAFWKTPINFNDPSLHKDIAPFIVMEDTPMSKLHFLFIMLNISQVNVIKKGIISGIIEIFIFIQKSSPSLSLQRRERMNKRSSVRK